MLKLKEFARSMGCFAHTRRSARCPRRDAAFAGQRIRAPLLQCQPMAFRLHPRTDGIFVGVG